ncbi:hypothetical protein KIN20_029222, partial [Parelaphostrongylus tenuis]
ARNEHGKLSTDLFMVSLIVRISIALYCGVLPTASPGPITVSGFSVPIAMVCSGATVSPQVSGIASDIGGAQAFVQRLVIRTVTNAIMANSQKVCGKVY